MDSSGIVGNGPSSFGVHFVGMIQWFSSVHGELCCKCASAFFVSLITAHLTHKHSNTCTGNKKHTHTHTHRQCEWRDVVTEVGISSGECQFAGITSSKFIHFGNTIRNRFHQRLWMLRIFTAAHEFVQQRIAWSGMCGLLFDLYKEFRSLCEWTGGKISRGKSRYGCQADLRPMILVLPRRLRPGCVSCLGWS